MNKSDIYYQFKEHHSITESGLDLQYHNAEQNHAFYSGDEMAYRVSVNDNNARKIVVFNRVKPFVNSIAGFMIKLRRKPDYQARERDSEVQRLYTTSMNSFSDYLRSDSNMAQVESMQDKEMLITGIGAVDTSISHIMNPYGETKAECLRYDEFGYDPQSRATNLMDARWVYRRKIMNRDDAAKLFKKDPEIFEIAESPLNYRTVADKYVPDANYVEEDLVQVFHYQWWVFENYYIVENPLYDQSIDIITRQEIAQLMAEVKSEIEEDNEEADPRIIEDLFEFDPTAQELVVTKKTYGVLKEVFDAFGVDPEKTSHRRKCFYTALISGQEVIKHFKSQDQSGFSIKFKTGDYDEINNRWQGIVDQLREPSRFANKALTEIMYVIASNSKGGVMYEIGAVQDPQRFEQQWASTDAAIRVNTGALSNGQIQPKAQAALPSGYENVLAIAKQGLFETTGVNPEFMGSSENKQVSALLESQRIEQVVSTLATYFDSITLYQKDHGRLMLTYMRVLYENNPDIIVRVVGEDGRAVFEAVNEPALFAEYDIDIQEVPETQAQKIENLKVMSDFAQSLLLGGINIYPALVDDLPIKEKQKQKIRDILNPELTPEQQQAQLLQQQLLAQKAQLELIEQETDINKKQTEIAKLRADIMDTMSGIQKVQIDNAKTQADTIKTLEEAEQTDIENRQLEQAALQDIRVVI